MYKPLTTGEIFRILNRPQRMKYYIRSVRMRTTLLILLFALSALAQDVPAKLCVQGQRGRIEIDTVAKTFSATVDNVAYSGPVETVFWEPELFYAAFNGRDGDFSFFTNITFKRHASFADIRGLGVPFRMMNREHLDCEGKESTAEPYTVQVYATKVRGPAPLTTMLCAVPSDFANFSTYQWSTGQVGQMLPITIQTPGKYRFDVKATYIDIEATASVVIEVTDDIPHSDPVIPPRVGIHVDKLEGRAKRDEFTFTAIVVDDGKPVSIRWEFSDGFVGEGWIVRRTFRKKGIHQAVCLVTDDDGAEGRGVLNVRVKKR